ncbi:PREDICTED: uncharacterized protein LOC101367183 [Odobenus rosmarus divergens]|uniref:Uncharacterized protein LOC101367183 n=1 Tax=Odobenus rosmarus divergens TaxID=9708 RepID=A0A9B0GXE9_ODORO
MRTTVYCCSGSTGIGCGPMTVGVSWRFGSMEDPWSSLALLGHSQQHFRKLSSVTSINLESYPNPLSPNTIIGSPGTLGVLISSSNPADSDPFIDFNYCAQLHFKTGEDQRGDLSITLKATSYQVIHSKNLLCVPSLLTHNENMVAKVGEVKSTIKFLMKKVLCLAVAVGHVKMTEDELVYDIHLAVNFVVSFLKKNWQNVRALYIKSTMRPN